VSTTLTGDVPEVPNPGVMFEVADERRRQDETWGQQDHPSILPTLRRRPVLDVANYYHVLSPKRAIAMTETRRKYLKLTWADILVEDLSSAVCASSDGERREELIALAATAIAWVETIDRRARS
jgi:hypothetical protein